MRSMRPGTPRTPSRPARTAAGSSPSPSPRATTASALWTLKRPARRSSRVPGAGRGREPDPQAVRVLLDARGPDVGGGIRAVGQDRRARPRGRRPRTSRADGVVAVDHRELGPGAAGDGLGGVPGPRRERLEQPQLRRAVPLEGAVQLQVLVGEVREHRGVVGDPGDPLELQGVGRGLEHGGGVAVGRHGPQRGLELGCAGRRDVGLVALPGPPDLGLHGADEPACSRRPPRARPRARNEVVVLPSVPVMPDDAEVARRVAVPPRRGVGERRPRARPRRAAGGRRPGPGVRRSPPPRRPRPRAPT